MNEIKELYFIASLRVSTKVSEFVIPGNHIIIEGISYQRISRKPKKRELRRKLINIETNERFLIY